MKSVIKFVCPGCNQNKTTIDHMGSISLVLSIPCFDDMTEQIVKPYHNLHLYTPGLCKYCIETIIGSEKTRMNHQDKKDLYYKTVISKLIDNLNTIKKES
jgi:hypothetical protein